MKQFEVAELLDLPQLDNYLQNFGTSLKQAVKSDNLVINKAVNRLIEARSKRLRPILMMFIASNHSKKLSKQIIQCCVAIELVHIASLVHDDIIDNAKERRGVETVNEREGINQAIIVGDFLFARANEIAAQVNTEVAMIVAKTITLLCEGEISEINDEYNLDRSISNLIRSVEGKTASLISASCEIAAVCTNLPSIEIKSLSNYGFSFGVAFQFIDDILDFLSSEKNLGKPISQDVAEGVYTMPILLVLKSKYKIKIEKLLKSGKVSREELVSLLFSSGSLEKSIILVNEYIQLAKKSLKPITNEKIKNDLADLAEGYFDWAFNNMVANKYKTDLNQILAKKIN